MEKTNLPGHAEYMLDIFIAYQEQRLSESGANAAIGGREQIHPIMLDICDIPVISTCYLYSIPRTKTIGERGQWRDSRRTDSPYHAGYL